MLPLFTLYRSANVSESVINDYFFPIKLALGVKKYSIYAGIVLSGLFLMVALGIYRSLQIAYKKAAGKTTDGLTEPESRIDRDLMISMQPQAKP